MTATAPAMDMESMGMESMDTGNMAAAAMAMERVRQNKSKNGVLRRKDS